MLSKHPGQSSIAVQLTMRGHGLDGSFLSFAADKARRLSLAGWAALPSEGEMTVVVSGPAALIDMLEVACMLGPVDVFVDGIERVHLPEPCSSPAGFTIKG